MRGKREKRSKGSKGSGSGGVIEIVPRSLRCAKHAAFQWLERAYTEHSNLMTTLKVDPVFDGLRGDARFQEMETRVGLRERN